MAAMSADDYTISYAPITEHPPLDPHQREMVRRVAARMSNELAEEWTHAADASAVPPLTLDDIRESFAKLGYLGRLRVSFQQPLSVWEPPAFDSWAWRPTFGYGIAASFLSRPIRYQGWKRFRAWYEAFCRRIGAETPWKHLPTMTPGAPFVKIGMVG